MPIFAGFQRHRNGVDFAAVNQAALNHFPTLVQTWLPNGRRRGHEWIALNPTRPDKRAGSFSVNLKTGRWCDFATGDKGGDVISLAAYLFNTRQIDAARALAGVLGIARVA
jgi:hypothetical protein